MRMLILGLGLALIFAGCGEKQEEKKTAAQPTGTAAGIEVSENKDAYKEKVEEKTISGDQSYYYPTGRKAEAAEKRSAIDANILVRSPYEDVEIKLLVRRLSKTFIVKCSSCHNDYANGIVGPSLLEKDAEFIYTTIAKYKQGDKVNVLMKELVEQMSDEEIRTLADEIAAFNEEVKALRARK